MTSKINVLIVGAGNIGAFYDSPLSENILTHAHAYKKNSAFKLLGFVDIDDLKAQRASKLWGCDYFKSIDEAFEKHRIDVVSVCVSTTFHYEVLCKLAQYKIKVIFAEKPLTKNLEEARKIGTIFKEKNIPVLLNYYRRFVPEFQDIKNNIQRGLYGKYLHGVGYYGKGFLNNGSHSIDLLRYLLGEIDRIDIFSQNKDFFEGDPSKTGMIYFVSGESFFIKDIDCRMYCIWEIDLFFEKKRLLLNDSGLFIEEFDRKESDVFKGEINLIKTKEKKTELNNMMYYAVKNIYNFLEKGDSLKCTLSDGIRAIELCI